MGVGNAVARVGITRLDVSRGGRAGSAGSPGLRRPA